MQNNFITRISPNVRIIILMLLILSLLLAKSLYLILFITTLTLILFIITNNKVNLCVKIIKRIIILLLIFVVAYIIVFRYYDIGFVVKIIYKLMIITILVEIILFNTNFNELHEGLYIVFLPLKKFNINIEKFSFNLTLSFYFFNFLEEAEVKIIETQIFRGKKLINIKNFIFPCIVYSINKLDELQENLKVKFYKLNNKKTDLKSKLMFILFLIFFIVCIFKEVIL